MGLKKNVLYSSLLTTGLYLSQLITYPYVTRTLGATNLGYCNFVQSFVQFFLLFSALGISVYGVREIAKVQGSSGNLNGIFSNLFILNCITTFIALVCFLLVSYSFSQFEPYHKLFWIGAFNIVFNLFNIEWLFRGVEEFKYITYRTLTVRIIYIVLIFLLIKEENHYIRYYLLSVVTVAINSIINWMHSRKFVKFKLQLVGGLRLLWKPYVLIGLQLMLLSYNNTINPVLLGLFSNDTEVGYFTTASKLTLIILLFYNAYTLVLMPRISCMIGSQQQKNAQALISKSYSLLYLFALPLIILIEIYAPEIVYLIAGSGYEGAILPMRISLPVILIGGISQITINQSLIPNGLEKGTFIASVLGVGACAICSSLFVPYYHSAASAFSWVIAEFIITTTTVIYAKRRINGFYVNLSMLIKYLLIFMPMTSLFLFKLIIPALLMQVFVSIIVFAVYIHLVLTYIVRDNYYLNVIHSIRCRM